MFIRQIIWRFITALMVVAALTGCSDKQREFKEIDFTNAVRFFCQKPNYASSPLQANSYVLYYDPETKLGNVGQFTYMGDYEWSDSVKEAHLYGSKEAVLTDHFVNLHLSHYREDKSLLVIIDRKTLEVRFDYKAMECKKFEPQELNTIKAQLLQEHQDYHAENDILNQI